MMGWCANTAGLSTVGIHFDAAIFRVFRVFRVLELENFVQARFPRSSRDHLPTLQARFPPL